MAVYSLDLKEWIAAAFPTPAHDILPNFTRRIPQYQGNNNLLSIESSCQQTG
jgi:hypothetical protein